MRLLNINTYKFCDFFGRDVPPYVILSHRWTDSETSYQDWLNCQPPNDAPSTPGISKIFSFCACVRRLSLGIDWVWVDVVCIDKKSSAELTETINSMYSWYAKASACVVYLHDLPPRLALPQTTLGQRQLYYRYAMRECEWFTRGWTIQELLAPSTVRFCDVEWHAFGDKQSLVVDLAQITGIPVNVLNGRYRAQEVSVAMRMSWASRRETTRPEDAAYCLLGLFDVNMPLLYGEGDKAFMRLQLEIIKKSDDESIFAWMQPARLMAFSGMLAPSAGAFEYSGRVIQMSIYPEERMPYFMTNKGLHFMSSSDYDAGDHDDMRARTPMGDERHTVKLGCFIGDPESPLQAASDMANLWEHGALMIHLRRTGGTWEREHGSSSMGAWCLEETLPCRDLYDFRGVQRLYIVKQSGL